MSRTPSSRLLTRCPGGPPAAFLGRGVPLAIVSAAAVLGAPMGAVCDPVMPPTMAPRPADPPSRTKGGAGANPTTEAERIAALDQELGAIAERLDALSALHLSDPHSVNHASPPSPHGPPPPASSIDSEEVVGDAGPAGPLARARAIVRELGRVGSTPALRDAISAHPSLAARLQPELHRVVAIAGEHAVPALIEAAHANVLALRDWAEDELDGLNKGAVAAAIQTPDRALLVDILDAYGRARDTEAVSALVAFAGGDRRDVRDAARRALETMGGAASTRVREAYRSLAGVSCPADWGYDRVLRELFRTLDTARLSDAYRLLDEGLSAERAGDLVTMEKRFDGALARAPELDRASEMVPGFCALAKAASTRERARDWLSRARRLSRDPEEQRTISADLAFLDAEDMAERGYEGTRGYERVLTLDPGHEGARRALQVIAAVRARRTRHVLAWTAAGLALAVTLVAAASSLLRRFRARTTRP